MSAPFNVGTGWMVGWQYNFPESGSEPWEHRRLVTNERLRHRYYIAGGTGVIALHEHVTEYFPSRPDPASPFPIRNGRPLARSARDGRATAYLHGDGLGSIRVITDENGRVVEKLDYDPWGKRREGAKTAAYHTFRGGFSGHEHLDNLGLIHMGGRVYDPDIGRFISADPFIDGAASSQGYNRYAYVSNNPLRYTDPTGHWGLGSIVSGIGDFFSSVGSAIAGGATALWNGVKAVGEAYWNGIKSVAKWVGENWRTIVVVAAVVAVTVFAPYASPVVVGMLAGAVGSGLSTALYGGSFSDVLESAFQGAVIGGVSAGAFNAVGSAAQAGQWGAAARVGAHSAVGGGMEAMQGRDFWRGALTAGLTQAVSPQIDNIKGFEGEAAARIGAASVLGGTTSVISGGKFENGAMTAAFSRGFNDELHLGGARNPASANASEEDQLKCYHFSRSGDTACYDTDGNEMYTRGYSGQPGFQNMPETAGMKDVGTIPSGLYKMNGVKQTLNGATHSNVVVLEPQFSTDRGSFRIHGGNADRTASNGCIIAAPQFRQQIANHGGRGTLEVRPEYGQCVAPWR
jgi:RHS repeat-associated protein